MAACVASGGWELPVAMMRRDGSMCATMGRSTDFRLPRGTPFGGLCFARADAVLSRCDRRQG
jgi:hypothetical protein